MSNVPDSLDKLALMRVAKLSESQRQALRLWSQRMSAKEIGRELGITHWAVHERLRSARTVLQVSTSGEAARLLAAAEASETYNQFVYNPGLLGEDQETVSFPELVEDRVREPGASEALRGIGISHLMRSDFFPSKLPVPTHEGDVNELTTKQRLIWIGIITVGIVLTVSSLITMAWGAARIFERLVY